MILYPVILSSRLYIILKQLDLFMDLLNKKELFPYSDPLSSININYYDKGDALGLAF